MARLLSLIDVDAARLVLITESDLMIVADLLSLASCSKRSYANVFNVSCLIDGNIFHLIFSVV